MYWPQFGGVIDLPRKETCGMFTIYDTYWHFVNYDNLNKHEQLLQKDRDGTIGLIISDLHIGMTGIGADKGR